MEALIGKQFKRNVYGLSNWTDIVKQIFIVRSYTKENIWKPEIKIKGEKGIRSYDISEIVFIN